MASLKKNFAYNIVYQILVIILPLVTTPYVSRTLGAANVGIYSYTYAVANYFVLIAMLGVKNYGNRSIAMVKDNKEELSKTFCNIYAIQISVFILSTLAYIGYVLLIVKENRLIALIQIFFVFTAAADITWFFFGMEEFKITVTRNTIIKLLDTLCIFIFVKNADDLWKYTLILSLGLLLGYLSVFPFLKKYIYFVRPTLTEMKRHFKPNVILFIPVIAVSLFNIMDKIMLGALSNMTQVGYYENTEKLMRVPFGVITALGTVMLPRMSHLVAKGNKKESEHIIEYSIILIMFLACAMSCGLAGTGNVFAPIFFGKEFSICGTLLIFIAPTILFLSWANVIRMQYLIPNGMDKEFTISTFVGAFVNLVINTLLIPQYSALGAIIGTVCAEASVAITQTFFVRKHLNIKHFFIETLPFLPIGLIMFCIVYILGELLETTIITFILQVIVGIVVYFLLSGLYVIYSSKDIMKSIKTELLVTLRRCKIK